MGTPQQTPPESGKSASRFTSSWKSTGLGLWLPFVIFYTVIVNIPFWVASHWLGISLSGWFCLDYLAVGVVALFVPRILAGALLLLAVAIDVTVGVSETYLLPINECFTNLGALRQFPVSRLLVVAVVVLLTLLALAAATLLATTSLRKNRAQVAAILIAFAVVSLSVDCLNGLHLNQDLPRDGLTWRPFLDIIRGDDLAELHLARIPTLRLAYRKVFPAPSGLPMRSASAAALSLAGSYPAKSDIEKPNIAVIVVESWGLDKDSSIDDALVQPYAQPELMARYQVLRGTVPFAGPTLGGEGRELCGSTIGFQLMGASAEELQHCLPDRLAALGYHNVALHGMVGDMFDRTKWYKRIGFQETWFFHQFLKLQMPICPGPFPGICDANIAKWMEHRLEERKSSPEFLYWMTLNSHLPVPVPSPLKAGASCSFTQSLSQDPALCSWYQLIANVHQSVAGMAMANLGRPTVFAIVGDHAPPFSGWTERNQFSQAVVPYVLLIPRRDQPAAK